MQLQKLNKKAKITIDSLRNENKTNQEVYEELKTVYADKKAIANLINSTPHPYYKQQTRWAYYTLLGVLVSIAVFKLVSGLGFAMMIGGFLGLLFVIVPIISFLYAYLVYDYQVSAFKSMAIFAGIGTVRALINQSRMGGLGDYVMIDIAVGALVVALLLYLHSALLPGYDPNGIIEGSDGEYIIPD